MLPRRALKLLGMVLFSMTCACNSGSNGAAQVDADGLYGVVGKTYYHSSPPTTYVVHVPDAGTKALRYSFDLNRGLLSEGGIPLESIRVSLDGKSITVAGLPYIYELRKLTPEQITGDVLSLLKPTIETICISNEGTGFKEIQFIQDESHLAVNGFDQNGMQPIASTFQKSETAMETVYQVAGIGDFQIHLYEPLSTDNHFFRTLVNGTQWNGATNLYCHQNRAPFNQEKHVVFVTSSVYNGSSGASNSIRSLGNADAICEQVARSGSKSSLVSGQWKAILSDSTTNARDRIQFSANSKIVNTAGETVVQFSPELWQAPLLNPIQYDQNGASLANAVLALRVWTGSLPNGTKGAHCSNWTLTTIFNDKGDRGVLTSSNSDWISLPIAAAPIFNFSINPSNDCATNNHLYCINLNAPPPPAINGVSTQANPNGTVTVTLSVSGYANPSSAVINGNACTDLTEISPNQLTCILPNADIPIANIVLSSPSAESLTGPAYHTLFIGEKTGGDLGGLAGADRLCQISAANGSKTAGITAGTWRAILSDSSTDVKNRISFVNGAQIRNTNGEVIVTSASDLWGGSLQNTANYNRDGLEFPTGSKVRTGSNADGTKYSTGNPSNDNCEDWTSDRSSHYCRVGTQGSADAQWLSAGSQECRSSHDNKATFYCINSND